MEKLTQICAHVLDRADMYFTEGEKLGITSSQSMVDS